MPYLLEAGFHPQKIYYLQSMVHWDRVNRACLFVPPAIGSVHALVVSIQALPAASVIAIYPDIKIHKATPSGNPVSHPTPA